MENVRITMHNNNKIKETYITQKDGKMENGKRKMNNNSKQP